MSVQWSRKRKRYYVDTSVFIFAFSFLIFSFFFGYLTNGKRIAVSIVHYPRTRPYLLHWKAQKQTRLWAYWCSSSRYTKDNLSHVNHFLHYKRLLLISLLLFCVFHFLQKHEMGSLLIFSKSLTLFFCSDKIHFPIKKERAFGYGQWRNRVPHPKPV